MDISFRNSWKFYFFGGLLAFVILGLIIYLFDIYSIKSQQRHIQRIYYVDNISEAHQHLIDIFNKRHEGKIEVVPVNLPFDQFSTNERKVLLARSLRGRSEEIDIFAVDLIWVPRFARWAEPLDIYFPPSKRNSIIPEAMESCFHEDRFVSVPIYIDIGLMYYRKDLLRHFGDPKALEQRLGESITWEELIKLRSAHPDYKQPFYMFAAQNFEGLVCSYIETLHSMDASIFEGDSVQLNIPASRKTLQLLVDMAGKLNFTPRDIVQFDEVNTYLYGLQNDAVMFRGWPGLIRQGVTADIPESVYQNLRRAPLPHFAGTKKSAVYGGWNLMVSKYSTKKSAAIKFIQFVLQPENQKRMFEMGGFIPVNQQVYRDERFISQYAELPFYRKLLDNGTHRPYVINYTQISDILSYYIQMAIKQEISVEDALAMATKDINNKKPMVK